MSKKPQTKSDAIRAINHEFPGATNATIKKLCFDRWKMQIQSNDIHATLGNETSRRDERKEALVRATATLLVSHAGTYRDALRILRTLRKGGSTNGK
jgi:hypothetical protein